MSIVAAMNSYEFVPSPEVAVALAAGKPVVALESTIFSHLGLPSPANDQALTRCIAAIRNAGAVQIGACAAKG